MVDYRVLAVTAGMVSLLAVSTAHADRAAADRCAAGLQPTSQTLYQASVPEVLGGESVRDALKDNAREMVMSGKLSRAAAQPAAQAAAPCLMQLK